MVDQSVVLAYARCVVRRIGLSEEQSNKLTTELIHLMARYNDDEIKIINHQEFMGVVKLCAKE